MAINRRYFGIADVGGDGIWPFLSRRVTSMVWAWFLGLCALCSLVWGDRDMEASLGLGWVEAPKCPLSPTLG